LYSQRSCKKLAALHTTGRQRKQSLHATGGQSNLNCTRVAASRMQIVPAWQPVACNMNKIGRNLHATGGHAGTICMRLAATRLQDKRQADKRCVKGHLYITIIFLYHWQIHILHHASNYSADGSWDIWFVKCAGTMNDKATQKQILHVLAASCVQSRQFFASMLREQLFEKK
jgi:hypothetical protein